MFLDHYWNWKDSRNRIRDATWQLNVAFLLGYQGKLFKASQHYRKAALLGVQPIIVSRIEDFMSSIAASDRDKPQLYFCLGYFNLKIKGDKLRAAEDFRTFLKMSNQTQFPNETRLALKWIDEQKV